MFDYGDCKELDKWVIPLELAGLGVIPLFVFGFIFTVLLALFTGKEGFSIWISDVGAVPLLIAICLLCCHIDTS